MRRVFDLADKFDARSILGGNTRRTFIPPFTVFQGTRHDQRTSHGDVTPFAT
jgi:hypothetical protein